MDIEIKCTYSEIRDIDKCVENPRNSNKHSTKQIAALAKIIKARGFRHPIVISKRSQFIVAGHGRLEAARLLGMEKVPVDVQDFESEADEYAFLESDNHIARYAEFDQDKMIENLKDLEIDLETFVFEDLGLLDFQIPSFEPVGLEEQGKLDELEPKIIECPSCSHKFDARQA